MEKLKILVSLTSGDNDFQRAQAAAALQAASRLGVEVRITYCSGDPLAQIQQALDAIGSRGGFRPDAIICHPAGGTALPALARAAVAAHVAWAVLDPGADYIEELRRSANAPVFAVSADQTAIGRCQAQQIAALLPRGGSVLFIQGPSTSHAAQARTASLKESQPHNVRVLGLRGMGWNEHNGFEAVEKWLQLPTSRQQPIAMIAAHNDMLALGARRGFEECTSGAERERWTALPFLGVDGLPQGGCRAVTAGALAATVVVPPTTAVALDLLVPSMRAGTQPAALTLVAPSSWPEISQLSSSRKPN